MANLSCFSAFTSISCIPLHVSAAGPDWHWTQDSHCWHSSGVSAVSSSWCVFHLITCGCLWTFLLPVSFLILVFSFTMLYMCYLLKDAFYVRHLMSGMHKLHLFVVLESKFSGMLFLLPLMTCECQRVCYTKSARCRVNVFTAEPRVLRHLTKNIFTCHWLIQIMSN